MSVVKSKPKSNSIYLSLGTNIEPHINLPAACKSLAQSVDLSTISSFWSGPPVGVGGPDYFNAAAHIHSPLSLHSLKRDVLLVIERDFGRIRSEDKYAPRTIDLDIIIFNDLEIEIDIWRYAYLAVPLAEIHPNYRNPETGAKLIEYADSIRRYTGLFIVPPNDIRK